MPKTWSKIIGEHGEKVRLFERSGTIYRDVTVGRTVSENGKQRTEHDIKSLSHSDRRLAEQQAKALAKRIAEAKITGRTNDRLTLGRLFAAYRRHHLPTLGAARQREAEARMAIFTEAWGVDLNIADVYAARVKGYCRKRRSLEVVAPGLRPDKEGKRRRGYRKLKTVRDGGLDAEFRWLNSVFNFAVDHRSDGRPLLARNPLPSRAQQRRAIGWPKEKNPRRPIASHRRFLATMKRVDEVDPEGRLGCILTLARFTGRRESAICAIRASDLLLSEERIAAALADAGKDERLVEHMPHGAIRWAAESDKQGVLFVSPISEDTRAALDTYRRQSPRMGDVPLFPAPKDPAKPIRRETAAMWLVKAEKLAQLPKLTGGVFHCYRRLWATERKHLPSHDVAAAGGWTDTQALTLIYQHADPAGVLAAVNGG